MGMPVVGVVSRGRILVARAERWPSGNFVRVGFVWFWLFVCLLAVFGVHVTRKRRDAGREVNRGFFARWC